MKSVTSMIVAALIMASPTPVSQQKTSFVKEEIIFNGTIESREHVHAIAPNGVAFTVLVVNGLVPSVRFEEENGVQVRKFVYDQANLYKGGVVSYQKEDVKKAILKREEIEVLKEENQALRAELDRIKSKPAEIESFMKRPSQFK